MVDNPFRSCFAFAYELLRDDPLPAIEERAVESQDAALDEADDAAEVEASESEARSQPDQAV
jgi:hypothetical protein